MLELKSSNYTLEEEKQRIQYELLALNSKNEELEKQLNKAQTVAKINPLSFSMNLAVKVDHKFRDNKEELVNIENLILQQQLAQENDYLLKRIEAQEKDFQVTNETLRIEIVFLQERNQKLKSKVSGR